MLVLRTREDAARLQQMIAARPRRVLVIGAGFTGSEIASACRMLGLPVTVAEAGPAPLGAALGGVIGAIAADIQRENGVDLRCGVMVTALSTYPEIVSLLHDPRISSDMRNSAEAAAADTAEAPGLPPNFLHLDPPEHDRLRRMTMRHFGPPNTPARIAGMEPGLLGIVTKLIDGLAGRNRIHVVDDLAYPFPVAVICELLGVPHQDEPRFHAWVEKGMESLDPQLDPAEQQRAKAQAVADLSRYLAGLVETHRRAPGDDLLSGMATDDGPEGQMPTEQIVSIASCCSSPATRPPDRFVPDRDNNQHLGFGGGIHLCFGGPLARLEVQIALTELARRLQNPRLVADPPPYRPNPSCAAHCTCRSTSTASPPPAQPRRRQARMRPAATGRSQSPHQRGAGWLTDVLDGMP